MKEELKLFTVVEEYPVHWGDMDAANHVNNRVYLKWGESSRIAYFRAMNIDTSFQSGDAGPILGWQDCKYIFPMTFPDTAIVGVRTIDIGEDRFTLESRIYSKEHQRIAAISKQVIIPYSYKLLKKVDLSDSWINAIKALDNL